MKVESNGKLSGMAADFYDHNLASHIEGDYVLLIFVTYGSLHCLATHRTLKEMIVNFPTNL
jgi:hypothetical protein